MAAEQTAERLRAHLIVMGSEATVQGGKVVGSMAVVMAKHTAYVALFPAS